MAKAPSPEPFKTICLEKGLLTPEKAEELVKLQNHLAESLDLPTDFLDLCKQKAALTDEQIAEVKKAAGNANASRNKPAIKELGGFEILGKAGEGAMGVVYKARQKSLDRVVALKILPPRFAKNKVFVERFIREARASAALNHPNIVQGIDVGEAQGLYYFAMEFLDGETVSQRFKREGPLPLQDVLEIGRQTALALAHAHGKGMIHRDIKPDNLMLARAAGGNRQAFTVKVMDLGLARMVEDDASMTEAGKAVGTPHYISPEQARGDKDLTARCDLYSLGCTLLHMAAGKTPYQGETAAVVMSKHLVEPPPDPKKLKPDMPSDVAAILHKLMAKPPDERYPSADALAEDLGRVLHGEKPKFVALGKGHGKSTGPVRPVTSKTGGPVTTTGKKRPVDPDDPTGNQGSNKVKPNNSLVYVGAGVAALLVLGAVGAMLSGGSAGESDKKAAKPATAAPEAASTHAPVPAQAKGPSREELEAQAKAKREAEAAARQKKLQHLHDQALAAEKEDPNNHERLRKLWMDLRSEGLDTPFAKTADEKVDTLDQRRKAEAARALEGVLASARGKAGARDYDGALAVLGTLDAALLSAEAKQAIEAENKACTEKAQAEGAKELEAAAALASANKKDEALKAFEAAEAFKFKPVAEAAAAKAAELRKAIEAEKAAAEALAAERFAQVLAKLRPLATDRKLDDAQTELSRALNDKDLAPRHEDLRAMTDGLKGYPHLYALVARRLEAENGKGISLEGQESIYYKVENERVFFKPSASFPTMSSRGFEHIPVKDLVALAGLKGSTAEYTLKNVPVNEIPALGGLLALLGEGDLARPLFERGKTDGGEPLARRLAAWDRAIAILQFGAAEAGASAQFTQAQSHANAARWKEARAALDTLQGRYGETAFIRQQAGEIVKLSALVMNGLLDLEADSVPLDALFKGRAKALSGGMAELVYDFQDPAQLQDFKSTQGNWTVRDGRLLAQHPPNDGMLWLKAPFEGDTIEVSFEGEVPRGDLNCLLGPEIRQDTLGGYSFRFGWNNNQGLEVIGMGNKHLARSKNRLNPGMNKASIARRGNAFTASVNNGEPAAFNHPDPLASRHVALQTWESAAYDNLRIAGKVDAAWLKSAKRTVLMAQHLEKHRGEALKQLSQALKGKLTDLGGGKVRLDYDFSDPAQAGDFEALVGQAPKVEGNRLRFGNQHAIAAHKARWRPPFTFSFAVESRGPVFVLMASSGRGGEVGAAVNESVSMTFGHNGRARMRVYGSQVSEREHRTPDGKPYSVDVVFDGQRWLGACEGQPIFDWTDANSKSADTFNRIGLGRWEETVYTRVSITGRVDDAWLASLTSAVAEPRTVAKPEPKPEVPPKVADAQPPPKQPEPEKQAEPKVLKTLYAKVQADLAWQDSRVDLKEGTPVRITAVGKWAGAANGKTVGPEGDPERKFGNYPLRSLLAKRPGGGEPLHLGAKWEGPWPGKLFLQMNDEPKNLKFSPGEMIVTFEVLDKLPQGNR